MNTQYSQWLEMNRSAMAPILRWNELAAATADKWARQGLTVAQDVIDLNTRQMQLVGEVKDAQKWAVEESKLLAEYGQKILGRAGDYLDMARELRESVAGWAESAAKAASDTVAPKTAS